MQPNLNELKLLEHTITEMECEDMDAFEAALESGSYEDMESIINLSLNLDCCGLILDVEDDEELGRWHVEGFDFCDVPGIDEFLKHIDLEAYGRSVRESESGCFVDSGYFSITEYMAEIYTGPHDIPLYYKVI